jgi:dienelactone hydrolase
MLRNALFIIAVAVFSANTQNTQTINLQGVVSNTGGDPISGAIVLLVRQNMKDTTGADGKYSLINTTSAKNLPAIVPQSNDISLKNNVLQFSLNSRSPIKVEIHDLKGNLLRLEKKTNATAGTYRFDILKNCRAAKVLLIRAAIGSKEVSFRYMAFEGGQYALTPLTTTSAISGGSGLTAMAAVADTLKVTATGFKTKSVVITSLENQQQNITLDAEVAGKEWPTADPTRKGPFEVTSEKDVGPLAGTADDPIYGKQKRLNLYYPKNLATSGYLHPILIWANGYKDNPEENPPDCVIDRNQQWCGQYFPIIEHLASHGFFVVAPLSTATGAEPLPTLVAMDWIIEQSEDASSPYYHRLDTSKIGQLGHSFGGMSTCMSAADPRYKALATICGTRELTGVHTPMLFYCGGKDGTVPCSGVKNTFNSVKNQPAFFIDEFNSDHGWWVYQGADGVSLSSAAAWFRVFLMNDTANRKFFFGSNCTFCNDNRVEVAQNSLMNQ